MKQAIILLMVVTLVPSVYAQQSYKENVYVFAVDEELVPAVDECAAGVAKLARKNNIHGINPNVAGKFKINTISTRKNAKLKGQGDEEVGELLICQDWQTYFPGTNLVPIYYEITIGGRTFKAMGGATSPDFAVPVLPGGLQYFSPPGYPSPTAGLVIITATVLPVSPGKLGGVYTVSFTLDSSEEDLRYDTAGTSQGSIHTLRVLLPVNP